MKPQGIARARALAEGKEPPKHTEECFRTITDADWRRELPIARASAEEAKLRIRQRVLSAKIKSFLSFNSPNKPVKIASGVGRNESTGAQ